MSQTLKVLESRGLIDKVPDAADRRVVHLNITPAGKKLLAESVPAPFLKTALDLLPNQDRTQLASNLEVLLRAIQQGSQRKSFAACKSCRFNEIAGDSFRCGLTGEALSKADGELICREHEYPVVT